MKLFFQTRDSELMDFKKNISFGRVEGDITFPNDDVVSTRHGQFLIENGKGFILDTGSTNGTFLNDTQLDKDIKAELHDGDVIRFGSQIVIFTTQKVFSAAKMAEVQKAKTGKELLAQARKIKESKMQDLEQKHQTATTSLKKLTDDLASISAKITLAQQAIEEVDKRTQDTNKEATRLETEKDIIRKGYEDKKKPLYGRQATFKDKLKLLDLAQAPEDQKIPLREELKKVEDQLQLLENDKNSQPQKILDLQKKAASLGQKRQEYEVQLEKLNQALIERQNKYASDINRLTSELHSLEVSLAKLKETLNK